MRRVESSSRGKGGGKWFRNGGYWLGDVNLLPILWQTTYMEIDFAVDERVEREFGNGESDEGMKDGGF